MLETFNTHRPLIFGLAYRMLGQVAEAEDLVQEVWLRWQKQEMAVIRSPKAWFVTTTTRLCLDQLRSARRQREEYYGVWLPEPLLETGPTAPAAAGELADSLNMAFMFLLETLAPMERAVFLLREVFDYDYATIGDMVGQTETNCRQIFHRAKKELSVRPPQATPPSEQARQMVKQFVAATTHRQVRELVGMLTDDATMFIDGGGRVKSAGRPIRTSDRVSRYLIGIQKKMPTDTLVQFVHLNSHPGYLLSTAGKIFCALAFTFAGSRIQSIYSVRNPDKLRHLEQSLISPNAPPRSSTLTTSLSMM